MFSDLFDRVLEELDLNWLQSSQQESSELEKLLFAIGALCRLRENNETLVIRFDILISALKIHGYNFGDISLYNDGSERVNFAEIGDESRDILNKLAQKAKKALQAYLDKQGEKAQESIRKKHVDLFSVVLIAFFDDIIEAKESLGGDKKRDSVIQVDKFFDKLYSLKVCPSSERINDFSLFFAYEGDDNYIDVKRLANATGEFVRHQYFKDFQPQ